MKEILKKITNVCKSIFGYSIMLCLLLGGMTFFGYIVAIIIGGDTAAAICTFLYKQFLPIIIYVSTITVLFGIITMYFAGEKELVAEKKKKK